MIVIVPLCAVLLIVYLKSAGHARGLILSVVMKLIRFSPLKSHPS